MKSQYLSAILLTVFALTIGTRPVNALSGPQDLNFCGKISEGQIVQIRDIQSDVIYDGQFFVIECGADYATIMNTQDGTKHTIEFNGDYVMVDPNQNQR